MVGHLRGFASRLAETCGEPALRVLIRLGVARAKAQGLTLRGPVRLFIELMVMFGSEFDKDPLLPWASAALDNPAVKDQMARAETLHRASLAYIETAVGPKDSYVIAALRRLDEEDIKGYDISSRNFEERALRKLRAIYPQKCVVAGDPALLWLVRRGPILANDQRRPGRSRCGSVHRAPVPARARRRLGPDVPLGQGCPERPTDHRPREAHRAALQPVQNLPGGDTGLLGGGVNVCRRAVVRAQPVVAPRRQPRSPARWCARRPRRTPHTSPAAGTRPRSSTRRTVMRTQRTTPTAIRRASLNLGSTPELPTVQPTARASGTQRSGTGWSGGRTRPTLPRGCTRSPS